VENGDNACLGWGWYLQIDFQLFVVGVFLIYVYSWKKLGFYILNFVFITGSTIANYIVSYNEGVRLILDL
jgi:hypothetical protein